MSKGFARSRKIYSSGVEYTQDMELWLDRFVLYTASHSTLSAFI